MIAKLPPNTDPDKFIGPLSARLQNAQVRVRTVTQTELSTSDAIENLSNFIGIVGLVALLLGCIGVASGVRAFVARKIDTVAVPAASEPRADRSWRLRHSGSGDGLAGAAAGAALGVAVQFLLPTC